MAKPTIAESFAGGDMNLFSRPQLVGDHSYIVPSNTKVGQCATQKNSQAIGSPTVDVGSANSSGDLNRHCRRQAGQFVSFVEGRKIARTLNLRSKMEWNEYCRSVSRMESLPSRPDQVYAGQGWKGYGDWLGAKNNRGFHLKSFRPFEEAQAFARKLNLGTHKNWEAFCRSGKRPDDIPSRPDQVYGSDGWKGWCSWLRGESPRIEPRTALSRGFRPFEAARKFAQSLNLGAHRRWEEFCRTPGLRPTDIPSRPDRVYALDGWRGWSNWLGTDRRSSDRQVRILSLIRASETVNDGGGAGQGSATATLSSSSEGSDDIDASALIALGNLSSSSSASRNSHASASGKMSTKPLAVSLGIISNGAISSAFENM